MASREHDKDTAKSPFSNLKTMCKVKRERNRDAHAMRNTARISRASESKTSVGSASGEVRPPIHSAVSNAHSPNEPPMFRLPDLSFPWRLMEILSQAEANGFAHVVSWVCDGTAFQIYDEPTFEEAVLPKFFPRMTKMKSFKRQLTAYNFSYVRIGVNRGACKKSSFRLRQD